MPGSTTNYSFSYPLQTDPVDVAADIQTLATNVDTTLNTQLGLKANIASPTFTGTVTLPGAPTLALHAATKAYVDGVASGVVVKNSVRAATTTSGTLASSFANGSIIDGVTLATGNRILIKNQATTSENGIYTVNVSGAPTRATDMDAAAEFAGAFTFVEEGSTLADTGWVCTTNTPITVGTTPINFTQFSGAGTYSASAGITLVGNDFRLVSPVATTNGGTGLTSFTNNGAVYAISTSAVTSGILPVTSGGTGVTTSTGSGNVVLSTAPSLVNPSVTSGTFVAPTLQNPSVTSGTFVAPILQNPSVTSGTFVAPILQNPSVTSGTFVTPTLQNPSVTSGTFITPTLQNPSVTSGTFITPTLTGALLSAGTTTTSALRFNTSSNLLTTPQSGAVEFDGNLFFITGDTATGSSRQVLGGIQKFYLNSAANAIAAGTDFFPSGRAALQAGRLYHFRYFLVFNKNTAGTVTFQINNSAAANFTLISANMQIIVQNTALAAIGNILNAYAAGAATATFPASQSLGNNSNSVALVDGYVIPAANTRISITPSAYGAGTISTIAGSNYVITDLGVAATNYGNFG